MLICFYSITTREVRIIHILSPTSHSPGSPFYSFIADEPENIPFHLQHLPFPLQSPASLVRLCKTPDGIGLGNRRRKPLLVQVLPNVQVGTGGTGSRFSLRWTVLGCSLYGFLEELGPSYLAAVIILLNNVSWELIFFLSFPSFPLFFGINFLK